MTYLEREAKRLISNPLAITLTETFELGANYVLDEIKDQVKSFREDFESAKRNGEDIEYLEDSLIDLEEQLNNYV